MTPKQQRFSYAYAKGASARAAAVEAGYSEKYAASVAAQRLLNHPDVITEIKRLRARVNERAEKSATDVVNEYSKIAFADRISFMKEDPMLPGGWMYKSPDELTDDQRAVVEKVNTTYRKHKHTIDGEVVEFERQEYVYILSDKANALQQMGRHFGIFDDKLKLTAGGQNPFKNTTPEQLAKLKASFVGIMAGGEIIDGEYREAAPHLLPNGKGR